MVIPHSPIITSSGSISKDLFNLNLVEFNLQRIISSFVPIITLIRRR